MIEFGYMHPLVKESLQTMQWAFITSKSFLVSLRFSVYYVYVW